MSSRIGKARFPDIIIIGAGREGLRAANYIKSKNTAEYIIFPIEYAKGEHPENLKFNEKVTSAQMDSKMDHWVVMTQKKDDQDDSVTITEYKCHGLIIATGRYPYEWLKEKVSFDEEKKLVFNVAALNDMMREYKVCAIGFEEHKLYMTKGIIEICNEDFNGVIIVGAGPAGLAAAACIETRVANSGGNLEKLRYMIIEKSDCIAPLWEYYTYDKLTLQRAKEKCQLTDKPFPDECPEFPTREDFLKYLHDIANNLKVKPQFNEEVVDAEFDSKSRRNSLKSIRKENNKLVRKEYICRGIIVASGIDGEPRMRDFKGLNEHFPLETNADPARPSLMKQIHLRNYKNGKIYKGKKVLVVGYGDSGIDICGDLRNNGATPFIVVKRGNERTKELFKKFQNWPIRINLSRLSKLVRNFGKCENGIIDKKQKIWITAYSDIKEFKKGCVVFKDNEAASLEIDCVIMATGYTSNVRKWCKDTICFDANGNRKLEAKVEEMVKGGACAVGFTISGLDGIHKDAERAAEYEH